MSSATGSLKKIFKAWLMSDAPPGFRAVVVTPARPSHARSASRSGQKRAVIANTRNRASRELASLRHFIRVVPLSAKGPKREGVSGYLPPPSISRMAAIRPFTPCFLGSTQPLWAGTPAPPPGTAPARRRASACATTLSPVRAGAGRPFRGGGRRATPRGAAGSGGNVGAFKPPAPPSGPQPDKAGRPSPTARPSSIGRGGGVVFLVLIVS